MTTHRGLAYSPRTPIAVIDLETTGFGKTDRVVEMSIVTLDFDTFETLEEYDTLVNPERDISVDTTNIHLLTPSVLEAAPTFKEIAPAVAKRLNGSYLVAQNQSFEVRMLSAEFKRIKASFDGGHPMCTLKLSRRLTLEAACSRYGVELEQAHRALSDARASAGLLRRFFPGTAEKETIRETYSVARCVVDLGDVVIRTLRRENTELGGNLVRMGKSPWQDPERDYRYAVNLALDDGKISEAEKSELEKLRKSLGLSEKEVAKQHQILFSRALDAAKRDGRISDVEGEMLVAMATALEVDFELSRQETQEPTVNELRSGMVVCFTGSAPGVTKKEALEKIAEQQGLEVKSGFSKKLNLVVAADVSSFSVKAMKAREHGIPILSVKKFLALIETMN